MQKEKGMKVISLNVRGIREATKRSSIFSYLKDKKAKIYFLQETYSEINDEVIWQSEWEGKIFFSHGTKHSKGVCILIDPSLNYVLESSHASKSGRIVLITVLVNGLTISFCNIYAPNNQQEQLEFIQELNNCLIDKAEAASLVLGGDWNCTLSKFRNMLLITMEMFDLLDIQRTRHPNLNIYTYASKTLNVGLKKYYQKLSILMKQDLLKVAILART